MKEKTEMEISSSGVTVSTIVSALLDARRTGLAVAGEVLTGAEPSAKEAYAIQAQVASKVGLVGGFKVANKPDAPNIMAPIFAKDILTSPAAIDVSKEEDIGIELEVGFRIDAPLPRQGSPDRRAAIAQCLSAVAVIEIVRTRLPGDASPAWKLADNQINGGLVLGRPVKEWQSLSLGRVDAALALGDDQVLNGSAQVPGGDAFENFLVLEEMIGEHCGGLQPGQVVITGSLNGLPYVRAGTDVRGNIAGLGEVSLRIHAIP